MGIGLVAVAGVIWYSRVKSKRIVADDQGLHLPNGNLVTYAAMKVIDNRRWPGAGLVTVEYSDATGHLHHAILDAVIYENLPPLLNEIIARATAAEVVNPPEKPPVAANMES